MMFHRINTMLADLTGVSPNFPPTSLYNEGWLLRLVIDWFAHNSVNNHPLSVLENSLWYSEALLPSAFLPRFRGDPLGEARTHADGVIGHFEIGKKGKADFDLHKDARQFLVLEAKISSPLSSGTRNQPDFDQAARNVACMAEVLSRAKRHPEKLNRLGFYVLAPQSQIEQGKFVSVLTHESIHQKVSQRIAKYEGDKDEWYTMWFQPLIERIDIQAISWESMIEVIRQNDSQTALEMDTFYEYCLKFN